MSIVVYDLYFSIITQIPMLIIYLYAYLINTYYSKEIMVVMYYQVAATEAIEVTKLWI